MFLQPAYLAAALCAACLPNAAHAQAAVGAAATAADNGANAAGIVKRSLGNVTLERAGQVQAVKPGMAVRMGDVLRTGADGAAGITLSDDTLLTAGPGSELVISDYRFDPVSHDGNVLASLWRGTLSVVTGLIGKKAPEKVNVQTRSLVLGSRGTEFIVETGGVAP